MKQWQCHKGSILDSIGSFDVIECGPCGFKHIVPIPTPKELEQIYRDEYYSREKPLYLAEHGEDLEWWNVVYDERYDMFESFVPSGGRRILDVGSGPGFFLKRGKERGWETVGIEPSRQAASHSRGLGLNIIEGFLEESLADSLGFFTVIHMHEVLEHIPQPEQLIQLAYRLLEPGGMLCVIVPNDYNPLQQLLRNHLEFNPWWVTPPHHINYFDHDSLSKLIESVGFQVMRKTSTFPLEMFLLMGCNYVGNAKVGRAVHGQRKQMEVNLMKAGCGLLKQNTYDAFAKEGIGREVVLYARCGVTSHEGWEVHRSKDLCGEKFTS